VLRVFQCGRCRGLMNQPGVRRSCFWTSCEARSLESVTAGFRTMRTAWDLNELQQSERVGTLPPGHGVEVQERLTDHGVAVQAGDLGMAMSPEREILAKARGPKRNRSPFHSSPKGGACARRGPLIVLRLHHSQRFHFQILRRSFIFYLSFFIGCMT
jgi:hypothetical protein